MESLQLSQVLADLSNLGAAEPEAAAAIVSANTPVVQITRSKLDDPTNSASALASHQRRPSGLQRAWSSEGKFEKFDKFGRRILINSPRSGSAANSVPGTPRRGDSDFEDDVDRASTLIALYDIRSKLKQQDNSSLVKAREKINAIAAKQHAQQAAERNSKAADQLRRNRYSFPKPGL
ncbi:hypothetical protein G7Z17_g5626 [Cylindrodendrum hubeiense]|uniref:Uncharacterized protein n=1 Tax=Cylindrodendrum hubeiense TaxID=595255 RepID=A0A9P5HGQ8_9HYPO|nr:hypothetical protein G7Z17_g5626 [Cylindrodendrum hubeiense]